MVCSEPEVDEPPWPVVGNAVCVIGWGTSVGNESSVEGASVEDKSVVGCVIGVEESCVGETLGIVGDAAWHSSGNALVGKLIVMGAEAIENLGYREKEPETLRFH